MIKRAALILIAFGFLWVAHGASGHDGATGIIKVRMNEMEQLGSQMNTLAKMAKGEIPVNAKQITASATEMVRIADNIPDLFPPNSLEKPSEATATIWSNWPNFKIEAASLSVLASQLGADAGTLSTPKDLQNQLAAIGKTCKTCHKAYRIKK
ncbi:MAG: cytochrome c [Stappiaceae bacterium]